jgi:putative SOS response-associated peptidase YedK
VQLLYTCHIMCGRFGNVGSTDEVRKRYEIDTNLTFQWKPRYNIAPTQDAIGILRNSPNSARLMKFGLIPHWAKSLKMKFSTINARAETILEKPVYKRPFLTQRCLVPCSFYFEWEKKEDGNQPYLFKVKGKYIFSLAGIYDIWEKLSTPVYSFSIITTSANKKTATVHHRMPVIVKESDENMWLDKDTNSDDLIRILKPYPAKDIDMYAVSKAVNNPVNDIPHIIQPLSEV